MVIEKIVAASDLSFEFLT